MIEHKLPEGMTVHELPGGMHENKLNTLLQNIYDLKFKRFSKDRARPDGFKYKTWAEMDVFPTAIDFGHDGKTYQIKWELTDSKIINVSCPQEIESALKMHLQEYLQGTE